MSDTLKDKALSFLKTYQNDMSALQSSREHILKYYNQEKSVYDNVEGRSQVVTSDVHDVVEATLPSLMDIFYGGSDVVKASPQGPEDDVPSKLMEELINFQFQREINGYRILHDWFKAALMMKVAWVKYWWEDREEYHDKEYADMSEMEYQALISNKAFEVIKVETSHDDPEEIDDFGGFTQPAITYNVKGKMRVEIKGPRCEYVPEEEVVFNVREKDMSKCRFIAHCKRIHRNELSKYGIDSTKYDNYATNWANDTLYQERFKELGGIGFWRDENDEDFVYIYECFIDDYDKKGRRIPKIIKIWGDEVLEEKPNNYGKPTLIPLSPVLMPGRLAGNGIAEKAIDAQDISTSLTRSILDNIYFQNLGMKVVNPFKVEVEDLLSGNRPGGLVRTKDDIDPSKAIFPVPYTTLPQQVYQMLEINEARKENKTGVNKYSMGSDSREVNRTATGVALLTNNAQARVKQIARNFAETGVKELFCAYRDMNIQFLDISYNIQVNQQWQNITREQLKGKYDIIIDVGLGTGQKELKANQMLQALQISGPLLQIQAVNPENIKEMLRELWQNWGYKNTDRFVASDQQQPKQPDPMAEMMNQLAIEEKRHQIAEIASRGILNIAKADAAEVGTHINKYQAVMESLVPQEGNINGAAEMGQGAGGQIQIGPGPESAPGGGGQPPPESRIDPRILQALSAANPGRVV